jgi:FAD/FMN-containing dehydrogenase
MPMTIMADFISLNIRADHFIAECKAAIGEAHVLTEASAKARFEHDFWNQYQGKAAAVLRPVSVQEVSALVKLAAKHGISLVPQAGNTGLVNGGIPNQSGTQCVLSVERLNAIRHVDPAGDYIVVEAGCILDQVRTTATEYNRLFPLAMGSSGSARIGGNIATNAGGLNVLRYGMMRDLVLGLEVVLPNGEILDCLKPLRKDNTGYDLKQIFVGSEGTLGIITAAALRLVAAPRERVTVWLSIQTPEQAVVLFKKFRDEFGELISAFELLCSEGVEIAIHGLENLRRPVAEKAPWHLLIEVAWTFHEGLRQKVESVLEAILADQLCIDGAIAESDAQRNMMWRIREGQSESASKLGYILRSDVAVAIAKVPALLNWLEVWKPDLAQRDIRVLPFGHVGDGNLHVNFLIAKSQVASLHDELLDTLHDEANRLDGSVSAEHGVGREKLKAVTTQKSAAELALSRKIKTLLDPQNIFNPGVVLEDHEASP